MVEFEKGYWNIDELEIQEWIEQKQKGFMKNDVGVLKDKILEDLEEGVGLEVIDKEHYVDVKSFKQILNKRFGF